MKPSLRNYIHSPFLLSTLSADTSIHIFPLGEGIIFTPTQKKRWN